MNIDFYIHKGNSHSICQDYALVGDTWGVLADGCSSSPYTEFGAQLLCQTFKGYKESDIDFYFRDVDIGNYVWQKAYHFTKFLDISPFCLDATLVWLEGNEKNDGIWTHIIGDGIVFVHSLHSNRWMIKYIKHPLEAPKYLNYQLSKERQQLYRDKYGLDMERHLYSIYPNPTGDYEVRYQCQNNIEEYDTVQFYNHGFSPCTDFFSFRDYDFVGIASDGLTSFLTKDHTSISLPEVFEPFLFPLKKSTGKFVERRGNRFFNETIQQLEWSHYDDISLIIANQGK